MVQPRVFRRAAPQDRPVLILLGGQPGAGKTRAGEQLVRGLGQVRVTRLIGDDYRRFHPDYSEVLEREPLAMPDVTAQAAGEWLRLAVDHALENKYSILVEGTWRNAEVPLTTVELAAAHGYQVHAVAVGVQPAVSRLATLERYYRDVDQGEQARWTPGAAHEQAVDAMPTTAERIGASAQVHSCAVMTRSGEATFRRTAPGASSSTAPSRGTATGKDIEPATLRADLEERGVAFRSALREQMEAPLSPEQAREWLRQCAQLAGAHERHTRDNLDAQQTWRRVLEQDHPQAVASLRGTTPRSASTPVARNQPERPRPPDGPPRLGQHEPPGRTR